MREGDWKLLLDKHREPRELYNLALDPLEFFNRLDEQAARVAGLRKKFDAMLASIDNDPLRPRHPH